jgi:uroporphyrinogen-III synthase
MTEVSVLVTRPEGQAESLLKLLADAGYRGIHCPMLVIEELSGPDAGQRELLQNLTGYAHIIFVSSNAVRCGMRWIEDFWPRLPTGADWYAVGEGSAAALARYGLDVQLPEGQMNSEGLLELPQLQAVENERVLIVKGEGGRDAMQQVLRQRGALVDELACYRRRPPDLGPGELAEIIRNEHCGALILSSGEGLHNMVSLLDKRELEQVRSLTLVVPGARVAAMAREAGFGEILEAANATDSAVLGALRSGARIGG